MIRVAMLSNYPRDHVTFRGGVETATAALLEGLRAYQDHFEFHIVSLAEPGFADVCEQRSGFWFHFLSVPRHLLVRPRLPFRVLKALRELRRINPDLVHCQDNMPLALATCLGGYRRVFTMHGVKRDEASKRTGWEFWSAQADRLMQSYILRHFDGFICISHYAAQVIGANSVTFSIPNAVAPRFFQATGNGVSRNASWRPHLVFVGGLTPLKRPNDLLLAHAALRREFPTLETLFCGDVQDHGYVDAMRRRIADQGIEGVRFVGPVTRERLIELLSDAVALVLPSAQENAPMVIAEAMAIGAPIVATRVGGVGEMVKHGETGLLNDVGDVAGLTGCLKQLLLEPELRDRLGRHASDVARATYTPAQVARATVDAYRVLLGQETAVALGRTGRDVPSA